jgi:AcrR family transcriptional regulator
MLAANSPAPARQGGASSTTVDNIVAAATELFGARGLRGTTIAAIAHQVGLTDAGVLHHFSTKSAIIEAALERGLQQELEQMQEMLAPGGLEAISRMAQWGAVVEQNPEFTQLQIVLSAEGLGADSPFHAYQSRRYANVHNLVVELIREGVDRGEIRAGIDADWEASAVIAYLDGIRIQWFYSGRQLPLADAVRHYFEQLIDRLTP